MFLLKNNMINILMDKIKDLYNDRVKKYGDSPNSVHWE